MAGRCAPGADLRADHRRDDCVAASSLLCRAALRDGAPDTTSYTAIRLASGALVLFAITQARSGIEPARGARRWTPAFVLVAYAIMSSYGYLRLSARTARCCCTVRCSSR